MERKCNHPPKQTKTTTVKQLDKVDFLMSAFNPNCNLDYVHIWQNQTWLSILLEPLWCGVRK